MDKKRKTVLPELAMVLTIAALSTCTNMNGPGHTGTATETENVAAMVRNPGGTPAVHAKVRFYPVGYNPKTGLAKTMAAVDSAITDTNGNYAATLDTGTYNVLAAGDSGVLFQDSITVVKDTTVHPPADTLKAPGSLTGVIQLQPGDDARKVFILVMGTNTFVSPNDAAGNFGLANMADGKYSVRILSILDNYGVLDTSLDIRAGKNDTLADTIVLPFTGIPTPKNVSISYDTLKQIVTLSWSKPDSALVKGFNIYRRNVDSNTVLARINTSPITDTLYRDSTGIQDQTYEYRVSAVDKNATEGTKSAGVSVKVVGAFAISNTLISSSVTMGTFAVDKEGRIYLTDISTQKILMYDSKGNQLRSWNVGANLNRSQNGLFNNLSVAPNGEIYVYTYYDSIKTFDTLGALIKSIGSEMSSCEGISFYKDTVFVATEQSSRNIKIFDTTGNSIGIINDSWDISDNFYSIASDSIGNLYLYGLLGTNAIDRRNQINVVSKQGTHSSTILLNPYSPDGIMSFSDGKFVITSSTNVCCYNLSGNMIFRFTVPPTARKALIDSNGNLLIGFSDGKIIKYSRF